MIDNEYITIKMVHELKLSNTEKKNEELELYDCTHTNHLNELYSKETMIFYWGTSYCVKSSKLSYLKGSSRTGYPTNRLIY